MSPRQSPWSSTLPRRRGHTPRGRFQREKLPSPAAYFEGQGLVLHGRGRWRSALCPFHDDRKPSLRVLVDAGAFRCMTCGAHGGDVLAFHMQRHELRFVDAAKAIGAWEEAR